MSKPILIIITGLPATGKTTLGRKLANELNLPCISKDDIKELLFDTMGFEDREWSKKIGVSSYELLYYMAESILKSGSSLVLEANFDPRFANKKILELKGTYNFELFQIRCFTEGEILFERFKKRAESHERHQGHVDSENLDEWYPILLQGKIEALNIGGEFFDIDTTEFNNVNYDELVNALNRT